MQTVVMSSETDLSSAMTNANLGYRLLHKINLVNVVVRDTNMIDVLLREGGLFGVNLHDCHVNDINFFEAIILDGSIYL